MLLLITISQISLSGFSSATAIALLGRSYTFVQRCPFLDNRTIMIIGSHVTVGAPRELGMFGGIR